MSTIHFATTNSRKITEARTTLEPYGISVKSIALDIDEIQHADFREIAIAKARAAFAAFQKPIVVSDTSWEIPALNGFPGGYMKDVAAWFSPEDWLNLLRQHADRTIICHEQVAYCGGENVQLFSHAYRGECVRRARGSVHPTASIENVVVLFGDLTLAEHHDKYGIASAGAELFHWQEFAEWYRETRSSNHDAVY